MFALNMPRSLSPSYHIADDWPDERKMSRRFKQIADYVNVAAVRKWNLLFSFRTCCLLFVRTFPKHDLRCMYERTCTHTYALVWMERNG